MKKTTSTEIFAGPAGAKDFKQQIQIFNIVAAAVAVAVAAIVARTLACAHIHLYICMYVCMYNCCPLLEYGYFCRTMTMPMPMPDAGIQ